MEAEEAVGTREAAGEAGRRRPSRHTCDPEAGSGCPDTDWAPGWQRPSKGHGVGVHGAAGIRGSEVTARGPATPRPLLPAWRWILGAAASVLARPRLRWRGGRGAGVRARRAAGAVGSFKVSLRN